MTHASKPSLFSKFNAISSMDYHILIINILLVTTFIACDIETGTTVEPQKVYQAYALAYSLAKNETEARALFQEGSSFGTILTDISCSVNGRSFTEYVPWNYFPYGIHFAGLVRDAKFSFIDSKGQEHLNFLSIDSVSPILIPETFESFKMGRDTIMTWVGTPLVSDEEAILTLSTSTNLWEFSTSLRGDSTIPILRTSQLTLVPGVTEASLKRIRHLPLDDATTAGGKKYISIVSTNKSITILPSN
jgi:hypothetical protein